MTSTYAQLRDSLSKFLSTHLDGLEIEERVEALGWYCQGLGLEIPNKTSLGIATRLRPDDIQACRQRMQRALNRGRFSSRDVFARIQRTVFAHDKLEAYCMDDTGFAKKGNRSACVQRQYSGTLGKIGNCQVAVSLHGASASMSVCLDAQLYMPEEWANSEVRREAAGIPDAVTFAPKWQIALRQLRDAIDNGGPRMPVVADAGYGDSRAFRDGIRELGLHYAVAVSSQTTVWPPGSKPEAPAATTGRGRPKTRYQSREGSAPTRVDVIAKDLWDRGAFRTLHFRRGTKGMLSGMFCCVRVHSAEGHLKGKQPSEEQWLVLERDIKQKTGFKYYFSSQPKATSLNALVRLIKLRWRIERDYQDMKQKLGLDMYEGRTWGGFHRHFAMVALVHAFLALHREAFSPSGPKQPLDLGRLSSRPDRRPNSLVGAVPHVSAPL